MDRILRDASAQIELTNYDSAGVLADVDGANVPTLVVVDSGSTTVAGFTGVRDGAGLYHAAIPANLEVLDTYEVAWSWPNGQSRTSEFELVGGFLFSLADLRGSDPALSSTITYPAALLRAYRSAVEDVFESPVVTNRAIRPRGRRLTLDGTGTEVLVLPDHDGYRLVSASSFGVALTAPELAAVRFTPAGTLVRITPGTFAPYPWIWGYGSVRLLYEYGFRSTPEEIRKMGLKYARSLILESPLETGRATAVFTDIGGYRLTIPGRDGPTGIPAVDATLARYSRVGSYVA